MSLFLGTAREIITPKIGACLYGYKPDWHSTSVADDLTAIAFYFKSEEKVQDFASKIAFLFKLQKFHDTFCPNYEPDWNDNEKVKYCIYFSHKLDSFEFGENSIVEHLSTVYFPTMEIADKICNILNEEYKLNKGNKED